MELGGVGEYTCMEKYDVGQFEAIGTLGNWSATIVTNMRVCVERGGRCGGLGKTRRGYGAQWVD